MPYVYFFYSRRGYFAETDVTADKQDEAPGIDGLGTTDG